MADQKISAMPAATALTGAELLAGVQGGVNVKITTAQTAALVVGTANTFSAVQTITTSGTNQQLTINGVAGSGQSTGILIADTGIKAARLGYVEGAGLGLWLSQYAYSPSFSNYCIAIDDGGSGGTIFNGPNANSVSFRVSNDTKFQITNAGNLICNTAAIATTATDGFLYIATCNGTPTGTPTSFTGRVALIYDTSAHQFWIYDGGGWKQPKTPAAAAIITWQ